jgi:hypothetical protein
MLSSLCIASLRYRQRKDWDISHGMVQKDPYSWSQLVWVVVWLWLQPLFFILECLWPSRPGCSCMIIRQSELYHIGYELFDWLHRENSSWINLSSYMHCLVITCSCFRWLHEVQCQSYSRFDSEPLKTDLNKFLDW